MDKIWIDKVYCHLLVICCLIGMSTSLLTCRPLPDEVLKGTSLQLVMAQNRPPKSIYFWEDSLQRQVSFELYYFDQNHLFTQLSETPQFLVNGQPIAGATLTFPGIGRYIVSARIKDRISDNQIVLTVSTATDYLQSLVIKAPVMLLNADSISQLQLTYELIPKQGNPLQVADYPSPQLMADDQPRGQAAFFSTQQTGIHRLQATFLGIVSNPLVVNARPAVAYPLVRLPVVLHVPKEMAQAVNPTTLLAAVNQFYRQKLSGTDPNRADTGIEFYPASTNPQGQPLAIAGLHSLSSPEAESVSEAQRIVADLLHTWCPRQYINVFIGNNWIDGYAPSTNYSFLPILSASGRPQPTCDDLMAVNWSAGQLPAIHLAPGISWTIDNGTLAHELGHFLGLNHSFSSSCVGPSVFGDVPIHLGRLADQQGVRYSCQGAAFISDNIMDSGGPWRSFTQDQVQSMRRTLEQGNYIPNSFTSGSHSNERLRTQLIEHGSIIR